MDVKIHAIPTKKSNIEQPLASKHGILPCHPFRKYVVGCSGSGKTCFIINLLTRDDMYKGYFDYVAVISPTARQLDDSYKILELPDENFFEPNEEVLIRIMAIQKETIKKKGIENSPKVLLILDDIISYKRFCNSKILLKFAVMSRHFNISMMVLSQAYHRVPKSIRLNMSCIIYFRGSQKENETICDDFCAPGYNKRSFNERINYATKDKYEFLYIDLNRSIENGRYRKCLDEKLI